MRSRIKIAVFVVVSIFAIWWFGRPILESYWRGERLSILKEEVNLLENEKVALLRELDYLRTTDYVEKEARDKLNMVKEGEKIVILPSETEEVLLGEEDTNSRIETDPNWKKWKSIFFDYR